MDATVTRTHDVPPSILHYWGLVKDLDDTMKKELAMMLINSLNTIVVKPQKHDVDYFAGIWSDEEYMDAEELCKAIRDGRHAKSRRN
jgi:hypothetical protein